MSRLRGLINNRRAQLEIVTIAIRWECMRAIELRVVIRLRMILFVTCIALPGSVITAIQLRYDKTALATYERLMCNHSQGGN